MSNTREIEEAIVSRILDAMRNLHVGMPGRVESYDSATQRATVLPLILPGFIDEDGKIDYDDLQPLSDVPVMFLRSAAFSLTFPIAKGDLVYLQFTDFSIDEWLKEGGRRKPANHRNHDISDAVCSPRLYHSPTDQVHATDAVLFGNLRLGSKDASDPVALKSDLDVVYDAITTAATGSSDGGALYKTNMKTILDAASFPVSATKVKAE